MSPSFLVVGAGISGLATAVALQRRGHRVTVLEERVDASSGTAITIWPNALAALDRIGLGDAVRESGSRVSAGALRWSNGTWLRRPAPERIVAALGEPLVVLRRSVLTRVLSDALTEGTVETGLAATELVVTATGVCVTTSDGTTREATAVIGADGVGSTVARHLNGTLRRRYAGYTAWRGVAHCGLDPTLAGETVGVGTEFGHVPLGAGHTYWFGTERRPEGTACPGGELTHLRRMYAGWADPVPALLAATDPADVLRTDLYDREPARQWSRGTVVLVGDAAHPMRPHLGQGGCQGLEDAATLAHCVDVVDDLPGAFARYTELRRPRTLALTRESRLFGRIVNARPALLGAAAMRASAAVPEVVLRRHLAAVAGRSAFALSSDRSARPSG
ncbi:FAD-dependent oxidoreductase [Mycobacterium yunnanensis]|uniref:FAD-dependent oxidoreductase n=1 Tax=Mycobacterium yunnanensis TaxID=368477 RepID=A0A9X3C482_9MYCO|nr:FAD-dependent oxidoreductase [Mycobacterium yunnanensis]MCV7424131.1 FAD-dependent oxidoreductase [Mycobacterium yunnanensis]